MLAVVREQGHDLDRCCKELIERANRHGGRDNITLILLRIVEVPGEFRSHGRETLPLGAIDTTPGFDTRQSGAAARHSDTMPAVPRVARPMARTQETIRRVSDITPQSTLAVPPNPAPAPSLPQQSVLQRPMWERSTGRMPRVSLDAVPPPPRPPSLVAGQPTGRDPNEITAPVIGQPFGARPLVTPAPQLEVKDPDTAPIPPGASTVPPPSDAPADESGDATPR